MPLSRRRGRRIAVLVRRFHARSRPQGAFPWRGGSFDRASGVRPFDPPDQQSRACREQGRTARRRVEWAVRLGIDPDQPYQRGAEGARRQRRSPERDQDDPAKGLPVRGRCQGAIASGAVRSPGRDSRQGSRHAGHVGASRQAFPGRAAVPEPERRSGAGVFRRRGGRRHHRRAVADALAVRHRTQFQLHLQRPGGGREAGGTRAGRPLRAGRQPAQGRPPHQDHRPAHRCHERDPPVGGALRKHHRRHFRSAGRNSRERGRRDRSAARAGGDRTREAQAHREARRLRLLSPRDVEFPSRQSRRHLRGARPVLQGDRARPGLCFCIRHGLRLSFLDQVQPVGRRSLAGDLRGCTIGPSRRRAGQGRRGRAGSRRSCHVPISKATSMAGSR